MADIADNSDEKIEAVVALGRLKIEKELRTRLKPITYKQDDGSLGGVCHWCESEISAGHLFCSKDPNDSGKCCSEMWEHNNKRRKETGV